MFITVKNVDVETVQGGKNSYQVAEVLYDTDKYKNQVFKVMSFVNPAVFATISKASKGDTFNVDVSKNAKGYNQWNSISPADGSSPPTNESSGNSRTASSTSSAAPVNRSFETKEERDARQRLIVRQSSLTAALGTLSPGSKGPLDPAAVLALADQYTDWVFEKTDIFDTPDDLPE